AGTCRGRFNPRSSREERPCLPRCFLRLLRCFNPRSSREERRSNNRSPSAKQEFQSTLLSRGATKLQRVDGFDAVFQSTLLSRGATHNENHRSDKWGSFNPRSSREERHS